ncbi:MULTISPECIES: hypothetical protein [Enterobacterales]|uniref:Lipoprotein n=1 Tax=Providencia rettgeri TaxID=587 RepID=U5N6F2_PRORE|nr:MULTISPECIES: hypothetical protein [Enterobacterales]ELB1544921.1 hypothetical protein [Morganella morganii]HAZ8046725.1 hypothetical protein [Escherichia coli]AGX85668.1 hypothetical protein 09AY2001NDM_030 [Providencia rettgeri]ARV76120.1 hypothetical protein PRE19P2_0330 [Providencia rettgeri]EIL1982622.1 hypothetical protein [Providencia rettgeri]
MKKSFIFCCLLATSLSGCSSADKPIFGCGNYVKTSTISIESGYGGTANDVIDKQIARKAVTATYPADYTYRENWKDTNRGGASLRQQGYRHVIASPYEIYDQGKKHIPVDRSFHTDLLISSLARSSSSNVYTKPELPSFCGENSRNYFLKETPENKKSRNEYIRIKEKYCSDPEYKLTNEELVILQNGEPDSLKNYRMKIYIDNQNEPSPAIK